MESRLHVLVEKMKALEKELAREIQRKEAEYHYRVLGKKVAFEEWIGEEQKALVRRIIPFIRSSTWPVILSAPVIWAVFPAALFFDVMVTVYHAVCFPIYGIPKVKRSEYIIFDRHNLPYLTSLKK